MDSYIQIKRLHSDKKQKDFTSTVLVLGDRQYFISLPLEAMGILLNKGLRDMLSLENGFESQKFKIDLGD